jgi:uncharacterized membrane protein (DUF2068 family)
MGYAAAMPSRSVASAQGVARRLALRSIAGFEAVKGVVALAAGMGLLGLLHRDLHHLAASLIGHIGLDPDARYPAMILRDIDQLRGVNLRSLLLAVSGYALVRFAEAYGLWNGRPWGEWLGALAGALYLPFELRHMIHRPSLATAAVIAFNIAVVGFLSWQLWLQRRGSGAFRNESRPG